MRFIAKSVVVTGSASGMGEAVAKRLAREGASVLVADFNEVGGTRVVSEITAAGGTALFQHTDVSDPSSAQAMVDAAVTNFGKLDLAANVAGIGQGHALVQETELELWQRVNGVNSSGLFFSLRAEIPALLAAGGGAIVNVASLAGLQTFKSLNAYVASKHAAVGLTKNAALENKNIRVNGIAPGAVLTPMLGNLSQEEVDGYAASVPSGRLGTPQDIANVVAFLLSEEASFVNGAVIPVDGGLLVA
ncbi:SDR family NAD(P)-dependent oxidoreductase [Streptomyces anthocyanicus]|uniref:SDR family NAD(P)-dependent oxidoreductase n=1 Tax=Streptomyces anthocyanicus TaxID=68174 RepID=UPI002F91B1F2